MRKYFLFFWLLFICQIELIAQSAQGIKKDSLLIEKLHEKLPSLRDTARINCLNELAKAFLYRRGYDLKAKSDSVYSYALIANKEATQLNYEYGLAWSLVNLCYVCYINVSTSKHPGIDYTTNLNKWIDYQKQLLVLSQQLNDQELLGQTYSPLYSVLLARQNKFKESDAAIKAALTWYEKSGNERKLCEVCQFYGYQYYIDGEYEKAFDYFNRSLQLAKKNNLNADADDWSNSMIQVGLTNMSELYQTAGDYETALNFLREIRQLHIAYNGWNTWGMEAELADLFLKSGQYDSAFYYLGPLFSNHNSEVIYQWPILADAYFMTGKYDSAGKYYDRAIDSLKIKVKFGHDPTDLVRCYNGKSKILGIRLHYKAALGYAKKSYAYARQTGNKSNILDSYDLLSKYFHQLGKNDSAYLYLRKYIVLKDSIITKQFLWRLNNYKKAVDDAKKENQISLLDKDYKIKEQQLKQETTFRNFIIAAFIAFLFASLYVFRNLNLKRKNETLKQEQKEQEWKLKELENENKQVELQKQSAELEMQALRAQMNPHFIFNSLSSINHFILKNESKTASNYLTRFSRLIRMVLINSQRSQNSLDDELQMLELYLGMERLRFKNAFDYSITFLNTIDSDSIFIPPLLLQPFCENAIWHGLMHKEGQGRLDIELSMDNNILYCTITDNGIGREKAEELKSKTAEKEKSMGLKITTDRLALLNREKGLQTHYEIEDLKDENGNAAGTKVVLKISYKESVSELA